MDSNDSSGRASGPRAEVVSPFRRVIFLNRFYRPDHSATSQMLTQLAEHLASHGSRTVIVTGRAGYDSSRPVDAYEVLDGVEVHRVGGTTVSRANLIARASQLPRLWWAMGLALYRVIRPGDIVVALTDPPLSGIVAWLAARMRGARVIHWLQDMFPEVAMAALSPSAQRLAATSLPLRDAILRRSDGIVVIGERMRNYVRSRAPHVPMSVIANWADDTVLVPQWPAMERPTSMGDARLIAGYQGNLGRVHDASTVLEAAERLRTRTDIHFRFTGGGVGMTAMREEVKRRGLMNFTFGPYVQPDRLPESLSIPDIHLISLRSALEGFVVPSKVYSALSVGRGVIFLGSAEGEVARIVRESGAGTHLDPGADEALAALLVRLADDPSTVRRWGENARRYIDTASSRARSFEAWRGLLASLPD